MCDFTHSVVAPFLFLGANMKLVKALNNNVAMVLGQDEQESVVMGKGIAFNIQPGDSIREELIEKRFILGGTGHKDFDSLLKRINVSDVELASEIIRDGQNKLGYKLNDSILLTLSDHLGLVLERARKNLYFGTALQWDIKLIYPKEYEFAKEAIQGINTKLGFKIPEQEAAFIALHFINAKSDNKVMEETVLCTRIVQNILDITRLYYEREFSEEDFNVNRFISHVVYFVRRQMNGTKLKIDDSIAEVIEKECPGDFACASKISQFLEQLYGWNIERSELLYLSLHLNRININ
jgi:beta-glucoside operon transcriptional antiterminator